MLEEEQEQARLGSGGPDHYTCTKFLLFGLDLEHKQYVFSFWLNLIADISKGGSYARSSHSMT
jgi:hypothetical protein